MASTPQVSVVGMGIDISTIGIAVQLSESLRVGQPMTVTLAGGLGNPDAISTRARVIRCDPRDDHFVVGLRFLD